MCRVRFWRNVVRPHHGSPVSNDASWTHCRVRMQVIGIRRKAAGEGRKRNSTTGPKSRRKATNEEVRDVSSLVRVDVHDIPFTAVSPFPSFDAFTHRNEAYVHRWTSKQHLKMARATQNGHPEQSAMEVGEESRITDHKLLGYSVPKG
ncbi:hypothetical protein BU26DRAFT_239343 [Trematosphaeria pertusa]|uniref:Uncharacterized protein n=1 Tax=Trematosphaeria pertusa TaxID=390896 RepID=A0A6A6HRS8_9PLEO|nr:uncharacterized protein BU26DRAFT_239343 [Trematosphaeria pertusa]KAF2240253.1 hypothetical protein BU26DRAFT_239343 [Trematosphaeria pertusa]